MRKKIPGSAVKPVEIYYIHCIFDTLNPLTAKLFNLNFYPLEVDHDQVSENYSDLTK